MESQIVPAFVNLGALGLMLWWLTLKLIPQLQQQQALAFQTFREEMQREREIHASALQQVIDHCQEELKLLMESKEG